MTALAPSSTTDIRTPPTAPAAPAPAAPAPAPRGSALRRGLDLTVRVTAGTLLWLGLLLAAYWWLVGGGLQDLVGGTSGLTSVARLTALAACQLLLVQVLLLARPPFLERAFGAHRFAQLHVAVGSTSLALLLVTVALTVWRYAAGQVTAVPAAAWELATEHVGLVLPLAAAVALLVAGRGTELRAPMLSGPAPVLHLYGYVGVALVLPYLLWTGSSLLPTATGSYWWTLWTVTAVSVLLWRVALPLWRTLRHDLRVVAVVPEVDHAVSIHLTGRRLDQLAVEPGQRLGWRFLSGAGWLRGQSYALSSTPHGSTLRITAELPEGAQAEAYALRPGTRALFGTPSGTLAARSRSRRRVALIGAGAGVIPLRALAEGLAYEPGEAVLLHRYLDRPLFGSEFEQLQRQRGLELVPLPGHPRHPDSWLGDASWPGGGGLVTDPAALLAWVPDIAERDVFVSGPAAWVASVRRALEAAGTPHAQVQIESPSPALG